MNLFGSVRCCAIIWSLLLFTGAKTFPWNFAEDVDVFNSSSPYKGPYTTVSSRQEDRPELRIMPLGASIVWGLRSSDNNGRVYLRRLFRKTLRDQLRYLGWNVNMVGSRRNGNMVDNNVEAKSGDVVTQIHAASRNSYDFKPNVVLINAGTNDANQNIDIPNIGVRMESMINDLWAADGMSDTLIVLSTLLPTTEATGASNGPSINSQYEALVQRLRSNGRPIVIAYMNYLTISDLTDGTHPTDDGYRKMAYVWWVAIERAAAAGLIKPAAPLEGTTPDSKCDKVFSNGVYAGGLTQKGSGIGDGIYHHESQEKGIVLTVTSDFDRNQWFFARLYGRKYDDLLGWFEREDGSVAYGCWKNDGGKFTKIADLSVADNCIPRGVHFLDLNGDGYDDFACVAPDGNVYASINQRDGTADKPPSFKNIGLIKQNEGYPQARVRLGDIDGDGRGDYCVLHDNGNIRCWRNGWIEDKPSYWQDLGVRFTGKGKNDFRGVRFEDVNGDGRDDWVWLGDGLNVAWRQGFYKGASSGPTHGGMGGFVTDEEKYLRDRIHFARIYGEPQDFGLLGRQDYVFMQHSKEGGRHKFDMRVWKNIGSGGTKLEADGNKYCNMIGHSDGREDYVWTLSKGEMRIYPNKGLKHIEGDESFWGDSEIIWDPTKQAPFTELDRRDLHLVDYDGDGTCDIVWVNPDNDNRMSVWINKYPSTGAWNWDYQANPSHQVTCTEHRGLGIYDLAVRFGDLSGNGRGDYICMKKDGTAGGYLHNDDGTWTSVNQFKFAEGKDRANFRFHDVNGDGRDDLIWIDKFDGKGYVWYNEGPGSPADNGGSSFHWRKIDDPVYDGNHQGNCLFYPDLDGDGRADMHSLLGTWTNQAETWFNRCGGLSDVTGDDPGGVINPNLPPLPEDPGSDPGGNPGGNPGGDPGGNPGGNPGGDPTPGDGSGTVYVGQEIFTQANPKFVCEPPCLLVYPSYTLPEPTVIVIPPYTTSVEVYYLSTVVTTIEHDRHSPSRHYLSDRFLRGRGDRDPSEHAHRQVGRDQDYTAAGHHNQFVFDADQEPATSDPDDLAAAVPMVQCANNGPAAQHDAARGQPKLAHTDGRHHLTRPNTVAHVHLGLWYAVQPLVQVCSPCYVNCGGGGGGRNVDFHDPADPKPNPVKDPKDPTNPTGNPTENPTRNPTANPTADPTANPTVDPTAEPTNPTESNDACEPELDTSHGLCENGNYPVYDPGSGSVSCDFSREEAVDLLPECQKEVDESLEDSLDRLEQSRSCCPNFRLSERFSRMFARACPGGPNCVCPSNPQYRNNPPPNGYHSVFTCDYRLWPNVCANAQSAIVSRGKSPIMTFVPDSKLHTTNPYYNGKTKGWRLKGCQAEEYPFGSGNPNRNPNTKIWAQQSVLRLIPYDENNSHGSAMKAFLQSRGEWKLEAC
ncbi:carbohydrate esterase family 3 protein [Apiospora hydei]|uniref:Carbohydrate esterase family 3 protein n=1 Tax=Apiospora hydei TaxID=1337664 RepID=A0ABR1UU26_9PEZI